MVICFFQGMIVLYNSLIYVYGSFKLFKCLIDGCWVCKVFDYGLDIVKVNQIEEDLGEYVKYRGKFIKFLFGELKILNLFFLI